VGRELHETTPEEVFTEKLRRSGIAADSEQHHELMGTFRELLSRMQEEAAA
jgi:hypothetical protein